MATFEDTTANTRDLTFTAGDWTVAAGLPNGDNYASTDGSLASATSRYASGTYYDFRTGDWTIEFWIYLPTSPGFCMIVNTGPPGTQANTRWQFYCNTTRTLHFGIVNTVGGTFGGRTSAVLAASTWHHVVAWKLNGTAIPIIWVNGYPSSSGTAATGTAQTPGSGDYIWVGQDINSVSDLPSTVRLAKLAIYDRQLMMDEVALHYLSMKAA